ncbi:hypothetical protein [Bradyrhizobium sp. 153]|uniref:hypothetical protein n=1 Tax=Bradyrhizobium sp. 153 TaxID=2782627 RepID=UPI001FF71CC3|nr:hypothetical protein [Bradyrhizobium sp. 153]
MSSEANVQLLKEAYRQWNDSKGQSVDYWFDNVIGPQIKFDSLPRGAEPVPFARRYDDRTELRGYFDGLLADWSMEYYTMNEYVAQGDAVVARRMRMDEQEDRKGRADAEGRFLALQGRQGGRVPRVLRYRLRGRCCGLTVAICRGAAIL